jgi:predicted nuclease with TOPRIM domain
MAWQAQLREKQKQLEGLVGELNMEQAQADQHRDAIARLQKEHVELKRLVLAAKKRERRMKGKRLKIEEDENSAGENEILPAVTEAQVEPPSVEEIVSENCVVDAALDQEVYA